MSVLVLYCYNFSVLVYVRPVQLPFVKRILSATPFLIVGISL